MKTHSLVTKTFSVIFILLLSIFLTSCGDSDNRSDISYTSLTGMAVINEDNAVELALGAYFGGPFEDSYWAEQLGSIEFEPGTVTGNCGGSLTITVDELDTNGAFTGKAVFEKYCEDGLTISDIVNITGSANLNTLEINSMVMSFKQLSVSSVEGSVLMNGTINSQFGLGTLQQTMDYLIRDNASYKVYEIVNYQIDTEISPIGTVEITYTSGKYYHPDFGYVELESISPFIVYDGGYGADSGELLVKGNAFTKALLSVINSEDIKVEADTKGDGVYDFYWSSLD